MRRTRRFPLVAALVAASALIFAADACAGDNEDCGCQSDPEPRGQTTQTTVTTGG